MVTDKMTTSTISRWLSEYKCLKPAELTTYAHTIRQDRQLVADLLSVFEDISTRSAEVTDPICHQLFDFYRSQNSDLKRFTLEFVPSLIWAYLYSLSKHEKKKSGGIEACLLGIYNLEVVDKDGKAVSRVITIPTLASASLYHEPPSLASLALNESALMRYHSDRSTQITVGPLPSVDRVNAENRLNVLSHVMSRYCADIAFLSQQSHRVLCQMCSRLTRSGFESLCCPAGGNKPMSNGPINGGFPSRKRGVSFAEYSRIPLSSAFLVECLTAVYYAMFNGLAGDAQRALEDIHFRASYELYSEVLLVTNAIQNSLVINPSGQPKDGPMGISIALSPSQGNPAFNKDAITNASFRAKRLPEDIEVQDPGVAGDSPAADDVIENGDSSSNMSGLMATTDTEKHKSSPVMKVAKGPLKSIMKKNRDEKTAKMHRKESDVSANSSGLIGAKKGASHFKELLSGERHSISSSSRSPKHSLSSHGISSVNGNDSPSAVDPNAIRLHVVRSNSNRAVSEQHGDGLSTPDGTVNTSANHSKPRYFRGMSNETGSEGARTEEEQDVKDIDADFDEEDGEDDESEKRVKISDVDGPRKSVTQF